MKRTFGFFITLCIIVTFAGCNSNTKDSEDKAAVKPIIETAPVYSASPAATPFIMGTPSAATNESPSPTSKESTGTSPITADNSKNANDTFKLMDEESLGFLRLYLSNVEVSNELGEPTEKSEAVEWGADGLVHQTWYYRTAGIELDMVEISGETKVSSINITAPCKYKTRREIGIGSRRKDVIEAYKNELSKEESNGIEETFIVAGSIYGGVIFKFENDTVSGIFIGSAAE